MSADIDRIDDIDGAAHDIQDTAMMQRELFRLVRDAQRAGVAEVDNSIANACAGLAVVAECLAQKAERIARVADALEFGGARLLASSFVMLA